MFLIEKTKRISKKLELGFNLEKSGWYALAVSAKVKSEKQRGADITDDEDLRIEIDGKNFPKLNNSQRYLDSPAAFSGGQQKNALKIVYFILQLKTGRHRLTFIADEGADVEKAEINELPNFPDAVFDLHLTTKKRDRQPWITYVVVGAGVKSFTIKATTRWRFSDGDDLKIIIDGHIQKNRFSLLRRNWIFASSIFKKILSKKTEEKTFTQNLTAKDLHYIEIWADQTPTLEKVSFKLLEPKPEPAEPEQDEPEFDQLDVKPYQPGPNGEDYNRFDEEIKDEVCQWNKKFMEQKFPPPKPLDPSLVKAMIYVESRLGYGAPSTGYPAYPDIMQVADPRNPAIHTLNNDGWIDPNTHRAVKEHEWMEGETTVLDFRGEAKVKSTRESIHWGTRWLYHKAQFIRSQGGRGWRTWEQAVADYNQKDNWEYLEKVDRIYQKGLDSKGRKLWLALLILLTGTALIFGFRFYQKQRNKFYAYRAPAMNSRYDFDFYLKTFNGLSWKKFLLTKYRDNFGSFDTFYDEQLTVIPLPAPQPKEKFLAVYGKGIADNETITMVSYHHGTFRLIPVFNEYGTYDQTIQADQVDIVNLDDDPEGEIIEKSILNYSKCSNAEDEVWESYYDFDREKEVYRFYQKTRQTMSDYYASDAIFRERMADDTI